MNELSRQGELFYTLRLKSNAVLHMSRAVWVDPNYFKFRPELYSAELGKKICKTVLNFIHAFSSAIAKIRVWLKTDL